MGKEKKKESDYIGPHHSDKVHHKPKIKTMTPTSDNGKINK